MEIQVPWAASSIPDLECHSHSAEQTISLGMRLGEQLQPGDLLLLQGDLGSGKTHLVKGIAQGLGADALVTSPSFVLINEYPAGPRWPGLRIYHIDLYRLQHPAELQGIGIEEIWSGQDICLIEWPERAADALPAAHLTVVLRYVGENGRLVHLFARGTRYQQLVDDFRRAI